MATLQPHAASTVRLLRFDAVQRWVHWINAILFTVLIATSIPLYFGSLFGLVLPRFTVEQVHLWAGIALPGPILVSMIGPWGKQMRRDARRVNYWTREEIAWMKSFGTTPIAADKFNPGQKLNAVFVVASSLVMLVTGVILKWFSYFPVTWRAGSTFVHDVFAWLLVVVIAGHVYMAVTHRDSLASMAKGWVSERWAAKNAAAWLGEERATDEASVPPRT